eukprot:2690871-Pyramimonas_sp.AAC.1
MLRYSTNAHDLITPFFVRKKSGQLRIARDCRAVNARFAKCPKMNMLFESKLADLEFGQGEEAFTAQADLANYFYHIAIAEELSEYFALPAVD